MDAPCISASEGVFVRWSGKKEITCGRAPGFRSFLQPQLSRKPEPHPGGGARSLGRQRHISSPPDGRSLHDSPCVLLQIQAAGLAPWRGNATYRPLLTGGRFIILPVFFSKRRAESRPRWAPAGPRRSPAGGPTLVGKGRSSGQGALAREGSTSWRRRSTRTAAPGLGLDAPSHRQPRDGGPTGHGCAPGTAVFIEPGLRSTCCRFQAAVGAPQVLRD